MRPRPPARVPSIRALIFDVFGTVVDWRGSLIRECRALGRGKKLRVDWSAFTDAWPDARRGLALLKRRHVIATLSNGNVALLVDMAKHGRLPWDTVLSAELFRHYKPDPESYLGAAAMLGFEPAEVMLVAAHKDDLRAAQACGLATAFVRRPREQDPTVKVDVTPEPSFDYNAKDFVDLAKRMAP
jgi:2-haloacid dehalogenase